MSKRGCVFTSLHPLVHDTAVDKRRKRRGWRLLLPAPGSVQVQHLARAEPGLGDSGAPTSTRHSTEEMDADGDRSRDEGGGPLLSVSARPPPSTQGPAGTGGKERHPPAKKYRLTASIRAIVWELVLFSNECCRLENERK